MIPLKLIAACITLLLLSSCAAVKLENESTALKHSGIFNPDSKLDEGVYVVTASTINLPENYISRGIIYRSALATLEQGYNHFVMFRDNKDDQELMKAIKAKTVRKLYLNRIAQKSPLINKTNVLVKYVYPRYQRHLAQATEYYTTAVVVMFKDGNQGIDAAKAKKSYEVFWKEHLDKVEKARAEHIQKQHPFVRKFVYE